MQEGKADLLKEEQIHVPESHWLRRVPVLAGGGGILAMAVAMLLGLNQPDQFWRSYLVAWTFCLTLGLGGLFFVLLQFLTRAGWSVVVRRPAEHAMSALPLLALLFLPLFLGLHSLYEWTHAEEVARDPLLQHKAPYLNSPFFVVRSLLYLTVWSVMAWWFGKQSLRQDVEGDPAITRSLQTASAPGMLIFAITITFASFDWLMSLTPHWYSTIFGVYFFAGIFVSILALVILVKIVLQSSGLVSKVVTAEHFHDLGKLLFGFVVFWAYIAFSQFMLIWYANLPEETAWYADRIRTGWLGVTVLLAMGHFVLPFFFLLSREVKRVHRTLALAAIWLLVMHYLDLHWLVMPTFRETFSLTVLDLATLVGMLGLFLAFMVRSMIRPALVPVKDPRLSESLTFENM